MHPTPIAHRGFTLIELSIVLVIIGLIVGGVLVGQDLIRAAGVRATVSQIERYNTAARTFYGKYGYLPGDINAAAAAQFGFAARGTWPGQGDGNGLLEGNACAGRDCSGGLDIQEGETAMFWVDLSAANLLDGTFNTAVAAVNSSATTLATTPNIAAYMPAAKIGQGNYTYVWSGGYQIAGGGSTDGTNYFGLSAVVGLNTGQAVDSSPALTVQQAYSIDAKIDDGQPQSGNVLALYNGWGGALWAAGGGAVGASTGGTNAPTTLHTPASATTCYDNGNTTGATQQYSVKQNGGAGVNCALSFRFQ